MTVAAQVERVCVVGNLNIDLIMRDVPELPGWGRGVEAGSHLLASSGQGGYLAFALAALGIPTDVIGNVGDDAWGQRIRGELAAAGVGTSGVETTPGLDTALTVAIARRGDGERAFVGTLTHLTAFDATHVRRHWPLVERSRYVCVVGMTDMTSFGAAGAGEVLAAARQLGKVTILDTGHPNAWTPAILDGVDALLPDVDYLIINEHEAAGIAGVPDPHQAGSRLQQRSGGVVVVKCGAAGSLALSPAGEARCPARRVTVADAVGAGDSYNAGFILGLRRGLPLAGCMALGTAVASHYVSRPDDRYPTLAEVEALLPADVLFTLQGAE